MKKRWQQWQDELVGSLGGGVYNQVVVITIPGRAISWNAIYSQNSYWKRKLLADQIHEQVHAALLTQGIRPNHKETMFTTKVDIKVTAYFKFRPIDSSNVCCKLYEDGLKGWVIEDDGVAFVGQVTGHSVTGSATDYVEIMITPHP